MLAKRDIVRQVVRYLRPRRVLNTPRDSFGFLSEPLEFSFDGGSLKTRDDFEKASRWIKRYANADGYLYPTLSHRARQVGPLKRWKRVPKTTRPAQLYHLPASHYVELISPGHEKEDRYGISGFVVQSLAFIYGTKLQFWDWFVEGRIPVHSQTINIAVAPSDVKTFCDRAVPFWNHLTEKNRRRVVNLLFVHSVAGALEWDWQRFMLEYMVTDACYAIALDLGKTGACKHKHRFDALCDSFGLHKEAHWFDVFVRLRNHLFHETLWDGGRIFTSPTTESFWAGQHLRRFNHRLVTALLCGPGRYTRTKWLSIGTYAFFLD